jgi:hypothetical protein
VKPFRSTVLAAALSTVVAAVTALAPAAPASALPPWQDQATSWTNPAARAPQVRDLRFATHPRFDRVVIDVKGKFPGGSARYQRRFHQDGSNEPVPIRGRSGIALDLTPAFAHNANGDNVYDGPRIARPHFDTLKALAFTGDFEGHVSFGFALTHRADYRIIRLHDPQRLVIDFRHAQ